jgi:hypothetical protein
MSKKSKISKKSKLSKKSKISKNIMKRGFKTKNRRNRIKKYERYKKNSKRNKSKRLTGGARFEGLPGFKSGLDDRSINVSEGSRVVSHNILDIVYNSLGLPSVIYDLFVILYAFTQDHSLLDYDVNENLEMIRVEVSTPLSALPDRDIRVYDIDNVCKTINENFDPKGDKLNKLHTFINAYMKENKLNKNSLDDLNKILNSLESEFVNALQSTAYDYSGKPIEDEWKQFEKELRADGMRMDERRNSLRIQLRYIKEGIKFIKKMEILKLEYENTVLKKKMIFYRALNNFRDDIVDRTDASKVNSLSFGLSLFAGFMRDCFDHGASSICFLKGDAPKLSIYIFNPLEQKDLFYIPPLIPMVSIFGQGELFHGRSKIPIELIEEGRNQTFHGLELLDLDFSDKDNYLKPLVTDLTFEEIKSRFAQIRGDNYFDEYEAVEIEAGGGTPRKTGYKKVYNF